MSKFDKALENLASFIQRTHDEVSAYKEQAPSVRGPMTMFSVKGYGSLRLDGEDVVQYRGVLDEILSAKSHVLSDKYAEKLVQRAVLESLDINAVAGGPFDQRLRNKVQNLKAALNAFPEEWQVHLRVCGLAAEGLPMTVGNVTFCLLDVGALGSLNESISTILDQTTHTADEKQVFKQRMADDLQHSLADKVAALVTVSAVDSDAASDLAAVELRRVLDILNFYSDIIARSGMRCMVSLLGERDERLIEMVPTLSKHRFKLEQRVVGPLKDFPTKELLSPIGLQAGFSEVRALLSRAQRRPLKDAVLAAMQLAGRASVDDRREQAFLLYMISLESLLIPRKAPEITYRLSGRVAHLLGNDLISRKRIVQQVKKLYEKRSAVVHNGTTEVTEADLGMARFVAKNTVLRILTDEPFVLMETLDELDTWFEERLLE